jgi:HAMP domain-containing protein
MTLRTRILLGYGYLIGLLLLSVSVAAINSQRVAGNAKQTLERNIESLTAALNMLEQIERQDSETLLALLHPTQGTRLDEAEAAFKTALDAAKVVDDAGGREDRVTLDAIDEEFAEYRKARDALLAQVHEDSLTAAEEYGGATRSAFLTLKDEVHRYLARKKEALKHANDEASRTAVEGAVLLGVMVTVALLSLGFLSRSLQRDVLGRLSEVGHVTEAIAAGDRRRRVRDFYHDELGLVARQLNAALDRQHELESQMQGRLLEQRRVLVGLLNQWPTPGAMIGIDGELVASTLTADDELELGRLTPRVRAAAKVLMTRRFVKAEELAADIKASDGVRVVRMRALASGDNQIVGWLATFDRPRLGTIRPGELTRETSDVHAAATSGAYPAPPREPSGLHRAAGSASLGPPLREPSGLRSLPGSAALGPTVPPIEASGVRPVTMIPRDPSPGVRDDPDAVPATLAALGGEVPTSEDVSAAPGPAASGASKFEAPASEVPGLAVPPVIGPPSLPSPPAPGGSPGVPAGAPAPPSVAGAPARAPSREVTAPAPAAAPLGRDHVDPALVAREARAIEDLAGGRRVTRSGDGS